MLKKFFLSMIASIILIGGASMSKAQDNLTARQAAIIPIAAFTANGDMQALTKALEAGLEAGLGINDIKEVLAQLYAYAGFPRSLNGLANFMNLLTERKKAGINDPTGPEPEIIAKDADRLKIGAEIQTRLVGQPVAGPLFDFSPVIDQFLKEHLFCDIFTRKVLTEQEREIATIAALAALPAEPQLAAHYQICQNTGLTEPQLGEFVVVMEEQVGKPQAEIAEKVLSKVINK